MSTAGWAVSALRDEEIYRADPFNGEGHCIWRLNSTDDRWSPEHLGKALQLALGSDDFSLVIFPAAAWVKSAAWAPAAREQGSAVDPHGVLGDDHAMAALVRHALTWAGEASPEDVHQKLCNGATLSLKEVSDVLRGLMGKQEEK